MIQDQARVDAIRARAKAQTELIQSLEAKIVKGNLEALQVAKNQTDDIETFFLQDLERNERTPAAEARWLSGAERTLATWEPYLKKTAEQFSKFGDRIEITGA